MKEYILEYVPGIFSLYFISRWVQNMVPTHATKIWRGPNEFYFVKMVKNVVFIIPSECPNIE